MKILTLIGMGFVLASGAAQAAPSSWKVESEKRIYFAPEAVVKVQRDELHADEDYWDRISVTLSYSGEELQRQSSQIRNDNPGWEVTRLPMQKAGNFHLRISALGIDEEVAVLPSAEGPYFTASYFVKKRDSRAVKIALANLSGFLEVRGAVVASVPKEIVDERAELPANVCHELSKNGNDVYSAILSFPAVEKMIDVVAKREENRALLRKMVLSSCLEISERARVKGFADLLALQVNELQPQSDFVAEHRTVGREDQQLPLIYRMAEGE
ncbi:MAG: hypothetical protein ACXVBE_06760 [Bdellovibrionota bacterium]